jgi:hypothetical protein
MKSIPGYPIIRKEQIADKTRMLFVNPKTQKTIFVNASVSHPEPVANLIHEMTHLITLIYPFNPESKFEDAFLTTQSKKLTPDNLLKINSAKNNSNPVIQKTATNLKINPDDLKWYLESATRMEKKEPGYACGLVEKPANLMAMRYLFNLKPGQNITIDMIKPYITGEKHDDNVYWILCCWALNGFSDLQLLLSKLNKLAYQDSDKKSDNSKLA